jgi:hypothetical protein
MFYVKIADFHPARCVQRMNVCQDLILRSWRLACGSNYFAAAGKTCI